MNLQKKVIDDYLKINSNPTLKAISQDTGIQLTRVFRLINGSKMKLEEYEIFKTKIEKKKGQSNLGRLLKDIQKTFSHDQILCLEAGLNQKLRLVQLKQG